jgi:hypothetical protein
MVNILYFANLQVANQMVASSFVEIRIVTHIQEKSENQQYHRF